MEEGGEIRHTEIDVVGDVRDCNRGENVFFYVIAYLADDVFFKILF